jgi:predicted TIM-barrel fold metal-dependent hydrolase
MKTFDMHVHIWDCKADPQVLLSKMDEAGVFGGCILSRPPLEYDTVIGDGFDSRLQEVLDFCAYAPDRLFPILWIHPDEENTAEKIKIAAERGILGYKIICNSFYIYEERCLQLLQLIASLNKPVIFHTGILWDGKVSSNYNQPLNYEALLRIEGLRFSMGHCSWPWVDDCIALYGKFMNAANYNDRNAEMFFDLTPGTPEIYREELLRKLFTLGYDVENNVMFGTDNLAHSYTVEWATNWLNIDRRIMDQLGVAKRVRQKVYHDNLMRFLGITAEEVVHNAPTSDNANAWSCENPQVKQLIKDWYDRLNLPGEYRGEFLKALAQTPVSDAIEIDTYDLEAEDGKRNLLSFLLMCEALKERYAQKGIEEKILLDTLSDIGIWLDTWSEIKGELYLGELSWLKHHMSMQLFRLGRLQFCMGHCHNDYPQYDLKKGDPVIEVHIPADGTLSMEACEESFAMAREFFAKYFPEFEYRYFTCHSWLLDATLQAYLKEDSNIIRFQKLFTAVESEPSAAILRYVFKWNTNARNLKYAPVLSSFAEAIKKAFLSCTQFYETVGVIAK